MRGLYWIRSDLRITDNQALGHFAKENKEGIIFWGANRSFHRASEIRKNFIINSLIFFNLKLNTFGQELVTSFGNDSLNELKKTLVDHQIQKIYFSSEYAFDELADEKEIQNFCFTHSIEIGKFDQGTLIQESDLPFTLEQMPFIFTDFRKKIESSLTIKDIFLTPQAFPVAIKKCGNLNSLLLNNSLLFSGNETEALARGHDYFWGTKSINNYKNTRNGMLDWNDSSKLSPWFSLGILSPRYVYSELKKYEQSEGTNESTYWLFFELLWRDYFKFLSKKNQEKIFIENGLNKNVNYNSIKDKDLFKKWSEGKTSEPFINANMNELNLTGWMSNRGRQNVASYLIHELKIPWIWGARYFEEHLIDYDPDVNWGNWLYLSGNGTDPRSRVFNVKRQAEMYDMNGDYQKKWLKEN